MSQDDLKRGLSLTPDEPEPSPMPQKTSPPKAHPVPAPMPASPSALGLVADLMVARQLFADGHYALAIPALEKHAQSEVPEAELALGLCSAKGLGMERDAGKAKYYLEKAAEHGQLDAWHELYSLTISPKTQASSLNYLYTGMDKGCLECMRMLMEKIDSLPLTKQYEVLSHYINTEKEQYERYESETKREQVFEKLISIQYNSPISSDFMERVLRIKNLPAKHRSALTKRFARIRKQSKRESFHKKKVLLSIIIKVLIGAAYLYAITTRYKTFYDDFVLETLGIFTFMFYTILLLALTSLIGGIGFSPTRFYYENLTFMCIAAVAAVVFYAIVFLVAAAIFQREAQNVALVFGVYNALLLLATSFASVLDSF